MKKYVLVRIGLLLVGIIAAFAAIQGLGSYLVEQISQFDETAPILEEPSEPKIIKRQTLRLETVEFYMLQVGSFAEVAVGQEIIDRLADAGYRVYTKEGPPYKLWLGCFSDKEAMNEIPQAVAQYGQDIFVVSGLLNEVALSFNEDQNFIKERLVPVIGESDIMLKHSLKMFQRTEYQQYTEAIWQEMIDQLSTEIANIELENENILADEHSQVLAKALVDFDDSLENYQQSLQMILEKKNDQIVLLAQSYLQQAIGCYHRLIIAANQLSEAER